MSPDLLTDLRALRERTRADRHGYPFPLFLFGGLILLAPLCYLVDEDLLPDRPSRGMLDTGPFPMFRGGIFALKYPGLVGWYWLLTIVVGLAATGWWYRRRARRLGVESDTDLPLIAAGAALTGFLIATPVLKTLSGDVSLFSTPAITLSLLSGAAVAAAATLYWALRPARTERQRKAGMFAGLVFATLAFAALGVYLYHGFPALLVVAVALLVLAWSERSALLAAVATLFTAGALVTNLYDMQNVFIRLGWSPGLDPQATALQGVLVPAAILLVGGAVAAIGEAVR